MTEEKRWIHEGAQAFMRMTAQMIDDVRERRYTEDNYVKRLERFREYNLKLALSDDDRLVTLAAVNNEILEDLREMAAGDSQAEERLYAHSTSWQTIMEDVMADGV